ncbi:MAG: DUF542 domain-containing protein [Gemmatimonadota bacterium]
MSTESCSTCTDSTITANCTVDAVMSKTPAARAILNEFNIDTCCGGKASLAAAAQHAHVDPALVVGALQAAQAGDALPLPVVAPSCSCGCR